MLAQRPYKGCQTGNQCRVITHSFLSSQPKSLDKATELFDRADTNNDGKLTLKELAGVLKSASQEYSHLAEHVRFLDGCARA